MGYYERRVWSGPLLEVSRYYSLRPKGRAIARGQAEEPTGEKQALLNDVNAWKKLNRLILCNFNQSSRDVFATYTHRRAITQEEAMREERNLIARLKRARKRAELEEMKYIAITEEQGGWHTHLILTGGLSLDALTDVWGDRGRVMVSALEAQSDYKALARYLTKQAKECRNRRDGDGEPALKTPRRKNQRRWHGSRNLVKPVEEVKPAPRPRPGEPKPPKGYRLLPDWRFGVDSLGYCYMDYACMAEDGKGRRKRGGKAKKSGNGHKRANGKRGTTKAVPVGADDERGEAGAAAPVPHPQRGEA